LFITITIKANYWTQFWARSNCSKTSISVLSTTILVFPSCLYPSHKWYIYHTFCEYFCSCTCTVTSTHLNWHNR
jgi:hypothetical protein